MRQLHTFVLTILLDEQHASLLHGRVRSIATDQEVTFTGIDQLDALLHTAIAKDKQEQAPDSSAADGDAA